MVMMMMKRLATVLLIVGGLGGLAHAETKAEKTAKLAVTVPDGWKLDVKDLGIRGESKDKEVAVLAWPRSGHHKAKPPPTSPTATTTNNTVYRRGKPSAVTSCRPRTSASLCPAAADP